MELTLEQELKARIFVHKTAIVGGYLMKEYIDRESKQTGILLPMPTIQDNADKYSNQIIQKALENGTFDTMYNDIWDKLATTIPDNMRVIK